MTSYPHITQEYIDARIRQWEGELNQLEKDTAYAEERLAHWKKQEPEA